MTVPLTKGQWCGKHFHVKTSSWDSPKQNDSQQPLSLELCCPDKLFYWINIDQHCMSVLGAKELHKTKFKFMRWLNFFHANIWQKWIPYTTQIQNWLFIFNYAIMWRKDFNCSHHFSIEKITENANICVIFYFSEMNSTPEELVLVKDVLCLFLQHRSLVIYPCSMMYTYEELGHAIILGKNNKNKTKRHINGVWCQL